MSTPEILALHNAAVGRYGTFGHHPGRRRRWRRREDISDGAGIIGFLLLIGLAALISLAVQVANDVSTREHSAATRWCPTCLRPL